MFRQWLCFERQEARRAQKIIAIVSNCSQNIDQIKQDQQAALESTSMLVGSVSALGYAT